MPEQLGRTADVVTLRVGQHREREVTHTELAQLVVDVAFGRALVDEHRSLPDLEQDGVSLADVQNGQPEPGRRWARLLRADLPGGRDQDGQTGDEREPGPPPAG